VNALFRNMHTIKGNARTYGLLHLTNTVHEAEAAYDLLRQDEAAPWQPELLLAHAGTGPDRLSEYAKINDHTLGRKGAGRRGSVEKFLMVDQAATQRHAAAAGQGADRGNQDGDASGSGGC
jgi:two-component system chemotaxis sensor kinase CheA